MRKIVRPGLVNRYLFVTQEMRILSPRLQLHPVVGTIITYLDTILNDKREIAGSLIDDHRNKNICAIVGGNVKVIYFGANVTVGIDLERRSRTSHKLYRRNL